MRDGFALSAEEKKHICRMAAENLKAMRGYLGWSQSTLAACAGTTRRHISEVERGKTPLTWTLFVALSAIFALNPETCHPLVYRRMLTKEVILYLSQNRLDRTRLLRALDGNRRPPRTAEEASGKGAL
ncbi:MAG TPA: helix-turn-helix domain-containing protein [Firmicutes bacterium]|nr:helix-turn-helix domain-containing protein [Bacillota bacterium]